MKKLNLLVTMLLALVLSGFAQFQLNTVPPLNGGNGNQGVTFGLTSTQTIIIDTIFCTFTSTGSTDVWVTTTDLTGPPTVSAANGWTNLGTATIPTATTAGNIVPIPFNFGYLVTPGTSYRFYVNGNIGAGLAYTTGTAGVAAPFTDGTITIETGNLVGYGGPAPNPTFHPRQFNGGIKYTILGGTNDVGVSSIDSPGIYCTGAQPVIATIRNYGNNQVDSVDVTWEVNGVVQGTVKHSSQLDTLNGGGSVTAQINLGSFTFPQGLNDLRVWTSNPNGMTDTSNFNDTAAVKTGPALNGTFTIDPSLAASSTNYTSFSSLGTALNTFGVCGPVVVNVAAGLYNESFNLTNINGVSSTNSITIDGGDSSTTTLSHNGSSDFATFTISGTDYVTIRNLRVEATGNSGDAVLINSSNNTIVENCELWMNPTSTNFASSAIALSGSSTSNTSNANCNYNKIQNNRIIGGYYTVYMYGNFNGNDVGNKVLNNEIDSVYYYGTYAFYQDSVEIVGNTIDAEVRGNLQADGVYAFYAPNAIIEANYIHANDYGLYLYNFNNANVPPVKRKFRIVNNMIISETDWGVYMLYADSVDFFYNSVVTSGTFNPALQITTNTTNVIDDYDFRNNIFYSNTTEAFELTGTTDSIFNKFDNNVYYTGGSTLLNIGGTTYANLAAYQTAQPAFNAASLEGDPQFLSLTDLHIIGAFIDGAGDNSVPVTVDIDGDTRPKAGSTVVDPGADEFDPPLCPPSSNLGATNITLTSADIYWTGTAMNYQYEVIPAGTAQGSGTIMSSISDTVSLTGLTASTSYDFYVREVCGRGDTSLWIGPFTFNTSNGVPFFEDFETFPIAISGNPWPKGWTSTTTSNPRWESEQGTGANVNSFNTGPFYDHTNFGTNGGIYIYLETSGGAGNTAEFISPGIYVDTNQASLTLEFAVHMFGATMGTLEVLVDSNGTQNSLMTITGQQQTAQGDPYILRTANIGGYQGKSINLIFKGTSGSSFTSDIAIDDVRIFQPTPADASVTDIISPTSGCGLSAADSVIVEISNVGTAPIFNFPVEYTLNGGTAIVETYTDTILPGSSANHTFSSTVNLATAGTYALVSYTSLMGDGDVTNDTSDVTINSIPIVGGFPYSEGFENGNGGWTTGGVTTFALGTPTGTTINSAANGTQSWVTNLSGNYNNNEAGWVESPCFDFSTLVNPVIELSTWWSAETSWDGTVLQSSIDGGATWQNVGAFGDPDNWYTDNSVNGLTNLATPQDGWATAPGSGAWVTSKNTLTGLGGVQGVILRVAFGSDGSVNGFDGFGFDDVVIRESAAYDVALLSIESPISGAYTTGMSDSLRVTIANVGSDTANNVMVNYELNGGPVQTETIAVMLPGDTINYTFLNSTIPLPGPGMASTMDVYVAFALDSINNNDSILGYQFSNDIKGIPYVEDFESFTPGVAIGPFPGGWTSTGLVANPRWESEQGTGVNANSFGTGPLWDHTNYTVSPGIYMYMETSGGIAGDTADLISPTILVPATSDTLEISYWYFNFGAMVDTMDVLVENNGVQTLIRSYAGPQQTAQTDPWFQGIDTISGFAGQQIKVIFRGYNVNCCDGDIAIDDFEIKDLLVGVKKVATELTGVSVSPNPSKGLFNLKIENQNSDRLNLKVRDAQGRIVYTENLQVNGSFNKQLDFTSFAKGVYYLQIQSETESRIDKLIIQ